MGLKFWQYRLQVGWMQRFIYYLYIAIVLLACAELTKRVGHADILGEQGLGKNLPAMLPISDLLYYAGSSVESYFPLFVGSALAFAGAKNPSAGTVWCTVATWAGYIGATTALSRYGASSVSGASSGIDLGVGGGILVGLLTAYLWSAFYNHQLVSWARMFNGVPAVVLLCVSGGIVLGTLVGVLYQLLYLVFTLGLGKLFTGAPAEIAALIYGLLKPLTEVVGLDSLVNQVPFYEYGSCQGINGEMMHGSFSCFANFGQQIEGQKALFLAGAYPVVAFGITTMFVVLWLQLKKPHRTYWATLYWLVAACSMIAGSWKPALFLLAVTAWPLLLATAVFSGLSFAATAAFQVSIGYMGGAGFIDLTRWSTAGTGMVSLWILGFVFASVFAATAALSGQKKAPWLRLAGFNSNTLPEPLMGVSLLSKPGGRPRRSTKRAGTQKTTNGAEDSVPQPPSVLETDKDHNAPIQSQRRKDGLTTSTVANSEGTAVPGSVPPARSQSLPNTVETGTHGSNDGVQNPGITGQNAGYYPVGMPTVPGTRRGRNHAARR